MKPENCPECGHKLLQLYPDGDKRVEEPPMYCEKCIGLVIGDKMFLADEVKREFVRNANELEEMSAGEILEKIKKEKEEVFRDPEERIKAYFKRVFKWAFTEGFLRSYAHFKHQHKQGRMVRIKALWEETREHLFKYKVMNLSHEDLEELDRLIRL